jgi:hypothetical protein
MADDRDRADAAEDADALLPRLRVIEDQPLEERAAASAQLHDELTRALEGTDAPA